MTARRSVRITTEDQQDRDELLEEESGPRTLAEFVGQDKIKADLRPLVETARHYSKTLGHMLLSGPEGFGKAALAQVVASEMGANVSWLSGRLDKFQSDWVPTLIELQVGDVLVVDEIHLIRKDIENLLYRALGEFVVTWEIGRGRGTKEAELALAQFTLIGLTSRLPSVSGRMLERFATTYQFQAYDLRSMAKFVLEFARELGAVIDPQGVLELARRSRGTPRVADRLLRHVREYASARGEATITGNGALAAFDFMKVDHLGLDENDRQYLSMIVDRFDGGPVGVLTLANALDEHPDAIAEMYEPYLLRLCLLARTPEGRVVTRAGYDYLRVAVRSDAAPTK